MSNLHRLDDRYFFQKLSLIFHGRSNPDTPRKPRKAPLHAIAQEKRFIKLAQFPFDQHADPSILDTSRMTRVHFASGRRRPVTRIRYLLEHGPDPYI